MNPGGHHPRLVDYATGSLFWVELCPPKRHVEALTPSTCDCDLVWKQGLGVPESGGSSALCGYSCPYERRRRRDTQGEGHDGGGGGRSRATHRTASRGPRHWARQARARPRAREGCGPPAPGLRPRPPDALLLATCGYGSSRQPAPRPGVDSFSRGSRIQTGAWSSHLTGNYVKRSSEFFFYYASGSRDASDTAKATPLLLLTETGTGQPTRPAPGPLLPSVWSVPRPGRLSLPVPTRTSHGGLPVR